jgi:hypothetical protein
MSSHRFKPGKAVAGGNGFISRCSQKIAANFDDLGFIFDDQDAIWQWSSGGKGFD